MSDRVIHTTLENGTRICVRPITSNDEDRLRDGIAELSDRSRYLRFFTSLKRVPDAVIQRLADADGEHHIAWGAIDLDQDSKPAIGAVHAMRDGHEAKADLAIGILDEYHAMGIARMLLTALVFDCTRQGITTLVADTLAENKKAIGLFRSLGAKASADPGPIAQFELNTDEARVRLDALKEPRGLLDVRTALDDMT